MCQCHLSYVNLMSLNHRFNCEKSALKSLEHENPTWLSGVWQKFQAVGLKIVQTHRLEFFLDDDGAWSQA